MDAVLRISISKNTRQTGDRAVDRHRSVTAPHDIFSLLAEAPFLRTGVSLIPHCGSSPDPACPLQGICDRRYCLQSMNRQIGAPFLQAFRTSYSHSAIQCVQDLWSLLSPSKSGSAFAALMLLYFWLVVRFLSFCFVPPDAYGGSVITASRFPAGML